MNSRLIVGVYKQHESIYTEWIWEDYLQVHSGTDCTLYKCFNSNDNHKNWEVCIVVTGEYYYLI